ncbi:MAG: BrnT family toxin [Chlamydiae bacterium]|nr:BrnT family toxin [Chlamydiota bacterium]
MKIAEIVWDEDSVEHIARHGVVPEEVEAVCFSHSSYLDKGRTGRHYVTGQTHAGRYLFIVVGFLNRREVEIITARDMDEKEKYRYKRRK